MRKIILRSSYLFLLCFAVALSACKKEDTKPEKPSAPKEERPTEYDGSLAAIEDYIGAENFAELKDMGFNFYEGNTPPIINGSYQLNSMRLLKSTVVNDNPNQSNATVNFSSQNSSTLSITYEKVVRGGVIDVLQSNCKIAGNNEGHFTVLINTKNKVADFEVNRLFVISGKKTPAGIEDYQQGMIMLDKGEAPEGMVEPNGKGRVIFESDGLAANN